MQKHEGYPSGSMVDFACDANGSPTLAVSSLAVHTKVLTEILNFTWMNALSWNLFIHCSGSEELGEEGLKHQRDIG